MRIDDKFTAPGGAGLKIHFAEAMASLKRAFSATGDRRSPRHLRELDTWSDQADVAFCEERHPWRA